ncbi:MAG: serine--tRNA ligase [Candidatus Shikimatogenerans bostrichidophilus]|nr:MAG: serine--tRNA ligase [Candidatus Shikimatogenerans bostrichidophilus]
MIDINIILKEKKKIIKYLKIRKFIKINIINKLILYKKKEKKILKYIEKYSKKINKYSKYYFLKKDKNIYNKIINIKLNKKKLNKKKYIYKKKIYKNLIKIPNIINKLYFKKYKNNINNSLIIYNNNKQNILKKKKYLTHIELSKKFELFNIKDATKISGTGFVIYSGLGLKLYNSLVNYLLYYNNKYGYKEYKLPLLVNKNSIYGTGQLPEKNNQIYNIYKDKLYLIPTGEVPLINLYKNKIFNINDLPIKSQTYTDCFRREAGSYGKKVKGLNRLHQFGKVEIVEITDNKNSNNRLKYMLKHIKNVLKSLKLKFRIKLLPCFKIGFTSSITYDFEVYSLGQKQWLEVSSLSNCLDYQSNNLNIFYKDNNIKKKCHTLNGSCIAIPRLLISIIEMYQSKNNIKIPKVLKKFF